MMDDLREFGKKNRDGMSIVDIVVLKMDNIGL